ncbi:copper chaperone PCu(A)C [Streptomyces sp. NPDC008001]|uniref:copper chaperone PCu(A)C n=1 Tax=Streptomyces sp. NPDC008001 TaxID=3364804 RepID=UPI0036EA3110
METLKTSSLAAAGRAALVPVLAGAVALGGLCAWTASGAAGRPPAVTVEDARVLLPLGRDDTAAFLRVRNAGDVDDELIGVDAPTAAGAMLSRTVVRKGAGHMEMVRSATVPAGGTLEMSPHGLDVMVWAPPRMKPGDRLPVVLQFRRAGTVRTEAEVVRAGSGGG